MSAKHNEPLPDVKWIVLVSLVIVVALLAIGMHQPMQSNALAAPPHLPTYTSPIGNPALTLDKTVDNPVPVPGDVIDYTLSYANLEEGAQAFNVRLYDFLPAGVEFLSASQTPAVNADGILMFTAASIGPGTAPRDVTVSVRVLAGYESLYNQVLVTADGVTPTTDSLLVNTVPATDHLTLTKTGDAASLLSGDIVYTLRCENTGPVAYNNVEISDVLPAETTLSDTSRPPDITNPPLLTWSVGTLLPGEDWEVTLTTTAPSRAGIITNTAVLNAPTHASAQALFGTDVITEGVILDIDKTGNTMTEPDEELVYTLTYNNKGNLTATNVVITDTLPTGVTVVDTAPSETSTNGQDWVWEIASLAPETPASIIITTTVNSDATGILHNVATMSAPGALPGSAELQTEIESDYFTYLPLVLKTFAIP